MEKILTRYVLGAVVGLLSFWASAAPLLYVPTGENNELVIIDLSKDKVVGRISELENTHGLSSSPNSEYLLAGSMQPYDPKKPRDVNKPTAVTEADHKAHHAGAAGSKPSNLPSFVSLIHPKHGHVMRRIAVPGFTHHTAVSPDGSIGIAVHPGIGGISIIDLGRMEVAKTLQTGKWPNYAVFSRDGKFLYVSNSQPGTVSEIDTQQWKVVREFKVGKTPEHMALGSKDRMLYVANSAEGTVSALQLASGKLQHSYLVGKNVHGIDVSVQGQWLFAANTSGNSLTRVDISSGKLTVLDLEPAPYHLTYIDGQNKLYVSSRKLPKIWVIDTSSLNVRSEIDIGKGVAHQMVIRNAP